MFCRDLRVNDDSRGIIIIRNLWKNALQISRKPFLPRNLSQHRSTTEHRQISELLKWATWRSRRKFCFCLWKFKILEWFKINTQMRADEWKGGEVELDCEFERKMSRAMKTEPLIFYGLSFLSLTNLSLLSMLHTFQDCEEIENNFHSFLFRLHHCNIKWQVRFYP